MLRLSNLGGIRIRQQTYCLDPEQWVCRYGVVQCGRGVDPWTGSSFGSSEVVFFHPGTPAGGGPILNCSGPPYIRFSDGARGGYLRAFENRIEYMAFESYHTDQGWRWREIGRETLTFPSLGLVHEEYSGGLLVDALEGRPASRRTNSWYYGEDPSEVPDASGAATEHQARGIYISMHGGGVFGGFNFQTVQASRWRDSDTPSVIDSAEIRTFGISSCFTHRFSDRSDW